MSTSSLWVNDDHPAKWASIPNREPRRNTPVMEHVTAGDSSAAIVELLSTDRADDVVGGRNNRKRRREVVGVNRRRRIRQWGGDGDGI